MKLGLSSYSYRWSIAVIGYVPARPLRVEEFIFLAADHRLQGVQLCDHLGLTDQSDEELNKIRHLIEKHGMFVETGSSSCEPQYLEKMIKISEAIGSKVLRVVPGINRACSAEEIESQVAGITKNLKQILQSAKKAGTRIALENHGRITTEELRSVISRLNSEYVGVCLDTMNSVVLLEKPEYTVEQLGSFTITAHFKDFKIIPDPRGHRIVGTFLGDGVVDFKTILSILKRHECDPNINIELFIDRRENEETTRAWEKYCVQKSVQYAREVLGI
jgi:sugar phosphate isomerase/epimerase